MFPRFAMPFGADAILTMETNTDDVWKYTDTNGDGVADKKELFTTHFGRAGTMESQQSSLFWAMDNWLYSTVNAFRVRWTPRGVLREPTGPNGAQWGVTQDNYGKVWFQHGASGMPGYFQFPVHYGSFAWPDQFEPDLNIVWGAPILIGDIQAGLPGTRMPDGSLIYGTAAAGNDIYRGDRLPKDLLGDYLYGEEVARIVRRLRPVKSEGLTQLRNVYPRSEFIRSLDPLFRPVDVTTAPDGTMYIADMYRGIIEGAEWAKEGTYLREKIEQYQLDKVMHHGRIWRLSYDGLPRDRVRPRMLRETPAQLVAHLSHPNGWWRDTAQQLLVLRQDSSVRAGASDARTDLDEPAGARPRPLDDRGTRRARRLRLSASSCTIRIRRSGIQAIRASETLYKAGDRSFAADYRALTQDKDADVVVHAMLTLNLFKTPDAAAAVKSAMEASKARGVQFVADRILNPAGRGPARRRPRGRSRPRKSRRSSSAARRSIASSASRVMATPERERRRRAAMARRCAPALAGSPRVIGHRDYMIKALLHGLTGPIAGQAYPQVMVPMGANQDRWIADVASFVRNGFGNGAGFVSAGDVARVRAASDRKTPWTAAELEASLPKLLAPDASWKVSASHESRPTPQPNVAGGFSYASAVAAALTFQGWSTGVAQAPGMWLQVELPSPVTLTEVQFTSWTTGGARGGPPAVWNYPRGYRLQVSTDGTTWSSPVAEGQGAPGTMAITFAPVTARFVRLTTTTQDDAPWGVRLFRLFVLP